MLLSIQDSQTTFQMTSTIQELITPIFSESFLLFLHNGITSFSPHKEEWSLFFINKDGINFLLLWKVEILTHFYPACQEWLQLLFKEQLLKVPKNSHWLGINYILFYLEIKIQQLSVLRFQQLIFLQIYLLTMSFISRLCLEFITLRHDLLLTKQ